MDLAALVAIAVGIFSLATSLIVVGVRIGRMQASIDTLDRDVAALAPIAANVTKIATEFHAATELIAAHMAADGHTWTLRKLERLQTLFDGLKEEVDKLEKRENV